MQAAELMSLNGRCMHRAHDLCVRLSNCLQVGGAKSSLLWPQGMACNFASCMYACTATVHSDLAKQVGGTLKQHLPP